MITSLRHRMHQDLQLAGLAEGTHAIGGHPPQDGMRQRPRELRLLPQTSHYAETFGWMAP
jgi:hypothetical protein